MHRWVVEVQIGLVRIEPMPVVSLGDGIPRPIRCFEILKDDTRFGIFFRTVAPDIQIALGRAGWRAPRSLEPLILVGGMIDHQLGDHAQAALMRLGEKRTEVIERSEIW